MSLSATINFADLTGWAYDASRNAIHMVGPDGYVRTWGLDAQQFTGTFNVGGKPGSVDISADGKYLLVGNTDAIPLGNTSGTGPIYSAQVSRVNLTNGVIDFLKVDLDENYERGVSDLAIAANGKALVTTSIAGSGWIDLRQLQVDGTSSSFGTIPGFYDHVPDRSYVTASEDRRHLLVEEKDSSGALRIYDAASGTMTAKLSLASIGRSGFNFGNSDINSAAGMVAALVSTQVFTFDLQLTLKADLTSLAAGSVVGVEFNEAGHQLFLWQGPLKNVLVIDTLSWRQVGSFDVSSVTQPIVTFAPYGEMDVIAGGRGLVLDFGNGLEVIDLAAKLKIEIAGDATGEILHGAIGADRLLGEGGADTIYGYEGQDFIRGGEGGDLLIGGKDFDDLHGNQGDDTVRGGQGDDWVVGGQGRDMLFGDLGNDLVFGNMGADTCEGGAGNDTIRGGQDNDLIFGGDGDDWISGDLGDDTLSGGAGADTFNVFAGSGVDRITDFSAAAGDRVRIEGSVTTFSVAQHGADTVATVGDAQVVLVGVQASSLPAGSIFVA